jgi:hypothetical protein
MEKATNTVVELHPEVVQEAWEIEWERCKPYIAKAVKHQDSYTIDDIEDKIRGGIFHLWPGKKSAYITEFVMFPQLKAGWTRKLKHLGFETEYLIKKDL